MSGGKSRPGEWEEFARPPLPRRRRLSPEQVFEDQRRRLVAAIAESVAARGYAATSVERVIEGAGVSRGTFYEHFANRGECLLAAHEVIFARLLKRISVACAGQETWEDGVAAAIATAVDFAARFPDEARLLTLDALAADGRAARQGLAGMERLATMLRDGEAGSPPGTAAPPSGVTDRAVVGGICSVVSACLLKGESPAGLESQLVQLVLAPYLGMDEAARTAAKFEQPQGRESAARDL